MAIVFSSLSVRLSCMVYTSALQDLSVQTQGGVAVLHRGNFEVHVVMCMCDALQVLVYALLQCSSAAGAVRRSVFGVWATLAPEAVW